MKIQRPYGYKILERDKNKLWLDKNENINPKLHSVIKKHVATSSWASCFYPENKNIYQLLADINKINIDNFIFTHGSDGGILNVFKLLVKPNDIVIITNPSFAMYEIYCKIFKVKKIKISYKLKKNNFTLDFESLFQLLINYPIKLICLPNPDSPTGFVHNKEYLIYILKLLKRNKGYLLVDEAYYPFHNETLINEINNYQNLIVVRSLSKAYGLAGLRVGYLASNSKLINKFNNIKPMYEVNSISLEVLNCLLKNQNIVLKSIKDLQIGKLYFESFFKEKGYQIIETKGNFSHVSLPITDRKKFEKFCYFRYFNDGPLKGYSRFSSTTKKNFKNLLNSVYS